MSFLPVDDLPCRGDVVFCKWPGEPLVNPARRVLVLNSEIRIDNITGNEFGVLEIAYGTGQFLLSDAHHPKDIIIETKGEALQCGLTKPTKFFLSKSKWLCWTDAKFVSPQYILNQGIMAGCLTPARFQELIQKI